MNILLKPFAIFLLLASFLHSETSQAAAESASVDLLFAGEMTGYERNVLRHVAGLIPDEDSDAVIRATKSYVDALEESGRVHEPADKLLDAVARVRNGCGKIVDFAIRAIPRDAETFFIGAIATLAELDRAKDDAARELLVVDREAYYAALTAEEDASDKEDS